MLNNQQINRLSRMTLLVFVSMFFSLNTYAVKKSAAGIHAKEAQQSSVVHKEKPSLFQRLSSKILSKKLKKKIAKYKTNTASDSKLKKGMAVAALVLGIVAFVTSIVGIVPAILAIIFGAIAMKRAKEQPEVFGGRKMAIAGLVLGIVYLSIFALLLFLLVVSIAFFN